MMTLHNSDKVLDTQVASPSPSPDEFCHQAGMDTDSSAAYAKSAQILDHNRRFIPGGVVPDMRALTFDEDDLRLNGPVH